MNKKDNQSVNPLQDNFRDSTLWDNVVPRENDIIIASCYKSGTTLAQQVVNILINRNDDFKRLRDISPWVDHRFSKFSKTDFENLKSPRILKTHLPFEALPYHDNWKYIYLVRDGRDVALSLYEHCQSYRKTVDEDGRRIDNGPDTFSDFWDQWIESGRPRWAWWDHLISWWGARRYSNVMFVHYKDMTDNKLIETRRFSDFLGIEVDDSLEADILNYSSLEYMKSSEKFLNSDVFRDGRFINQGINGRWRDLLSTEQNEWYLEIMSEKLPDEFAHWIMNGGELG